MLQTGLAPVSTSTLVPVILLLLLVVLQPLRTTSTSATTVVPTEKKREYGPAFFRLFFKVLRAFISCDEQSDALIKGVPTLPLFKVERIKSAML
jgi:hypothetical protein